MLKMTYEGDEPVRSNIAGDDWVDATRGTTAEVDDAHVAGLAACGWTAPVKQIEAAAARAAGTAEPAAEAADLEGDDA